MAATGQDLMAADIGGRVRGRLRAFGGRCEVSTPLSAGRSAASCTVVPGPSHRHYRGLNGGGFIARPSRASGVADVEDHHEPDPAAAARMSGDPCLLTGRGRQAHNGVPSRMAGK